MVHARPCRCRDSRPIEPPSGSSIVRPAAAAARLGSQESCDLIYKVTGLSILTNHAIHNSRTSRLFRMLLQLSSCYVRMSESRSLQSARLSLQSSELAPHAPLPGGHTSLREMGAREPIFFSDEGTDTLVL
jgi:hypothetical protein